MKWVSRRTRIWFLVMLFSGIFMFYRAWELNRPCREWSASHPNAANADPVQAAKEGALLNPCGLWYALPLTDQIGALVFVISAVGTFFYLLDDLIRLLKLSNERHRLSASRET